MGKTSPFPSRVKLHEDPGPKDLLDHTNRLIHMKTRICIRLRKNQFSRPKISTLKREAFLSGQEVTDVKSFSLTTGFVRQ